MIVEFPHGQRRLPARFDDGSNVTVVAKPPMPALAEPAAVGQRSLGELVASASRPE